MAYEVLLTDDAEIDLQDLYEYIAHSDSTQAAERVLDRLGQSLLEPMANLIDWADRLYSDIHAARARFDGAPGDVLR